MTVGSIGGTYGLSGSGLDIDSIVKKLMTGQQAKDDALVQKKTVLQWQKAAYNTIYDDISNFRNAVSTTNYSQTLSPNKAASSDLSVATATANAGAADTNHSLVVNNLASGVNLTSSMTIAASTGKTDKTSISTQFGIPLTPSFAITIGDGSTTKSITIDPSKSINQVVSDINSSGLNVVANYDSTLDRFFLATKNTGSTTKITMSSTGTGNITTDPGLNFISNLNLFATAPTTVTNPDLTQTNTFSSNNGTNASFTLDGTSLTQASNTFTISGVTYNLTGKLASPTTISVTSDIDTAVASIQTLVDSYNKILAELNGKLNETRYTDYPPLTDAQKAAMKDSDITAWNAKAQSGMLHNDSTLTSLVNSMRSAFSSPVSGIASMTVSGITVTYNSASSIGITTRDYTEGGKLYLDTTKLRTALQANSNALNLLFGASGIPSGSTTVNTQSQGIAGRLYDSIKKTMDQLATIAGTTSTAQYDSSSNLAHEITNFNHQISDATNTFNTMQSTYYKQYNALEVAIQQLNSQSGWVSSMLGTTTGK